MKKTTILLWFGPFILLLAGIGMLVFQLRKRKNQVPEIELSAEDARRAAELLDEAPASPNQPKGPQT